VAVVSSQFHQKAQSNFIRASSSRSTAQTCGSAVGTITWEAAAAARVSEGNESETTPEELIAAAHATCFTTALSSILALGEVEGKYTITISELEVVGRVAGIDEPAFQRAAQEA
jgi:lipoyl-dependent peroxiredoxin